MLRDAVRGRTATIPVVRVLPGVCLGRERVASEQDDPIAVRVVRKPHIGARAGRPQWLAQFELSVGKFPGFAAIDTRSRAAPKHDPPTLGVVRAGDAHARRGARTVEGRPTDAVPRIGAVRPRIGGHRPSRRRATEHERGLRAGVVRKAEAAD